MSDSVLHSMILNAFLDLKSDKKTDTIELVVRMCGKQGIPVTKPTILAELERVLGFLKLSMVGSDGKPLATSPSLIVKEGCLNKNQNVIAMDNFDSSRGKNTVPIVSHQFSRDLTEISNRPYLKITSAALNSEDFSTIFAEMLAKDECSIFFETVALTKKGEKRLLKLLEGFQTMFDSKVRVVLLCKSSVSPAAILEPFVKFVEKHFTLNKSARQLPLSETSESSKRFKHDKNIHFEEKSKAQEPSKKVLELNDEVAALKKENLQQAKKLEDVTDENVKLKAHESDEVLRLKQENRKLMDKLNAIADENDKLKSNESDVDILKNNLGTSGRLLAEVSEDLEQSQTNLAESVSKVKEIETVNVGLTSELTKVKADLAVKDSELAKVESYFIESNKKCRELEMVNDDVTCDFTKARKDIEAKNAELNAMRNIIDKKEADLEVKTNNNLDAFPTAKVENLKKVITNVRKLSEAKNITLYEALHRTVKKVKLELVYTEETKESVKCEMLVQRGFEVISAVNLKQIGIGKNKSEAKNNAVENILSHLETCSQ